MAARFEAGALIGRRYRLGRCIGEGGYGAVWEALDLVVERPVALKALHHARGARTTDTRRFRREAALLQQLRHPHVVAVHALDHAEDGTLYLVCELLRGRSLRDELRAVGPLEPRRALRIACELADALAYAHEMGVVHRDMKPANVFLANDPTAGEISKLLDFGIARALFGEESETEITATGQMLGTPQYMAPEQVYGSRVGPSVDTYALGLIVCEMMTGVRLVQAKTPVEACFVQTRPAPHALPPELAASPLGAVVARALNKVEAARFPSARHMLAELRRLSEAVPRLSPLAAESRGAPLPAQELAPTLDGLPEPTVAGPSPAPLAVAPRRRWPWLWIALGVALLAVAALGVIMATRLR